MAKRKQKNAELERQLKQRKTIFRIISILVAAAIVVAIGIGAWTVQDSRWILRYDGGRIATSDFRAIFHVGFESHPMAREAAMGTVQHIVALRDKAIYHNVDFTADERALAEAEAQQIIWMQGLPDNFITVPRLAELFFTEPLIERLTDIYVPAHSIDIDEEEFAPMLEEYLEEELYRHLDLQVLILILDELEEAEEAHSLIGTMDFEDIIRQFTPGLDEDADVPTTSAIDFSGWIDDPEDREYLLSMQAGEYSRIVEWTDGEMPLYFLFHAVSREEPNPDTAAESFRENFIEARREEIFADLVESWVEEANFVVNRRGYNAA